MTAGLPLACPYCHSLDAGGPGRGRLTQNWSIGSFR